MEHHYAVSVTWTGNLGEGTSGYRNYSRNHTVRAEGRPLLLGSADPTFRGDPDRWNPEQLLLAALAQCHLMSYLHVCVMEGVVVTEYTDDAVATMVTEGHGGRFVEAVLPAGHRRGAGHGPDGDRGARARRRAVLHRRQRQLPGPPRAGDPRQALTPSLARTAATARLTTISTTWAAQ